MANESYRVTLVGMSTRTPPGGAQPATPSNPPSALAARTAQLGHVYYFNGDAVQVTQKNEDGSVRVQLVAGWGEDGRPSSLGARVIRLLGDRTLMRTTTLPALEDGAPRVPPAAPVAVELPNGLTGTPKPNPGGHLDRARIEAALPTMSEAQLTDLLDTDKRSFVGPLVNNERERREAAAKASRPAPPRGLPVASAPPSYPPPAPQPKPPRAAPKAAPTPPPAPPAAPCPTDDDRAARARAAFAVLSKNAPALLECAAACKELEALGLAAPRFM